MNDDKSFIKVHRKMLKWEWYNDINTKVLFIHLLLIANWEDKKWQGLLIERGSVVTSIKNLSQQTKLSIQKVRTSLDKLKSTNEITIKTTNKYTVISINNYDLYQQNNKQNNKQVTNKQQTNNKQITTTKEYKENKEIKEYKEIINNSDVVVNKLFTFVEENFGRPLAPLELEEINTWKDNDLTRYAIKQAILNGKYNIKYISRILLAYERENIKTVQQDQEREREYETMRKKNTTYQSKVIEEQNAARERFLKGEKE